MKSFDEFVSSFSVTECWYRGQEMKFVENPR